MNTASLPSKKSAPTLDELKEEADDYPVFLEGENGLSHVLMNITDYERLLKGKLNIVEQLWMPDMPDIEFELPPRT